MSDISLLTAKRLPCPELTGPALQTYVSRLFQMYSGEPVSVRMRFEKSLTNVVIDHFGYRALYVGYSLVALAGLLLCLVALPNVNEENERSRA